MNHFHRYDEIIHLPHPVSQTHPRMGRLERAAQFSPFAALTGYDDAVRETARLTDAQRELAEDEGAVGATAPSIYAQHGNCRNHAAFHYLKDN